MLSPSAIALPLHVAILRVIDFVIALAGAVAAFCAVARLKFFATRFATARGYFLQTIQKHSFSLKTHVGVLVNCVSEFDGGSIACNQQYLHNAGAIVLANSRAVYTHALAPSKYATQQFWSASKSDDRERPASDCFYMDAAIAIEDAAHESVMPTHSNARKTCTRRFVFDDTVFREIGAHGNGTDCDRGVTGSEIIDALLDGCGATNCIDEKANVRGVFICESKSNKAPRIATVGHQESKPVGFFIRINLIEESFVNSMKSRSGHGAL